MPAGKPLIAYVALCVGLALGGFSLQAQETGLTDDQFAAARQVVDDYVQQKYQWPRSSYRIEFKLRDGDAFLFLVVHKDDENSIVPGGGKSISVDVDLKTRRVLSEFHFQ